VLTKARRRAVLWGARGGLHGHARYDRMIAQHVPRGTAADLRLPFCGFAANISRARLWTHERDSLQAIVRTNWTPPGVFAPFVTGEGDMLVDGAGAAPPPVEALRALGASRCFVVQPLPGPLGRAPAAYSDLSGLTAVRGLFRRGGRRSGSELPSIPDIVLRAQTPRWFDSDDVADDTVLLQPPMPRGVSLLDFAPHSRIMALARDWAVQEIAQLKADGDPAFAEATGDEEQAAEKKR
jgi:predicted acylesterase/phospholipase RssA